MTKHLREDSAATGRLVRRRWLLGAAASAVTVAAVLIAASPATQPRGVAEQPRSTGAEARERPPVVDTALLRSAIDYDYPGFTDISTAVDGTDIAIVGRVVGWREGRSFVDGEEADLTAVLTIEVTEPLHVPAAFEGTHVYVEVRRGGYVLDEDGEEFRNPGARPAYKSVEELAVAVPVGVRVIMLGTPGPSDAAYADVYGIQVLDAGAGHPSGTPLAIPHPQGLLFETHTGGVASGMDYGGPAAWGWLPSGAGTNSASFAALLSEAGGG